MFQPCTYGQWTSSLFHFRINDNAIPELLEGYKPETKKPGRPEEEKFDPYRHITEQQHRIALEAVFGLKEEYGYKELEDTLIKTYVSVGVKLNHKKGGIAHHHASEQTNDSAGERQKVHVHARLPLLAHTLQSLHFIPGVYILGIKRSGCEMWQNRFTLLPYSIYTKIK